MNAARKAAKALPPGLRRVLDRQQRAVYEAQAVVICVMNRNLCHEGNGSAFL